MSNVEKAWTIIAVTVAICACIAISAACISYNWKEAQLANNGLSYVKIQSMEGWFKEEDVKRINNLVSELEKAKRKE